MNEIISIKQKRHQKDLIYEKKMLRELSLTEIQKRTDQYFSPFINKNKKVVIEESCIDFAIEAFLLGAKYSRFGYYGEPIEVANERCKGEEKRLVNELFDYFTNWGRVHLSNLSFDELFIASEHFIHTFWKQGFIKGELRHKLRLH
ncbi:DUF2521 family protein [Metabacillus malikii]|uniref:DUF2521 family protein n=1 Tax=Metabacillus malikii TaxID=1504265 RepID=A0ABT9ZMN9_9BACI|nr:DUF2521 family protein [Metabacillus malikii]MDQ0233522.1 hypothetical protein [Metabacillus malikii]